MPVKLMNKCLKIREGKEAFGVPQTIKPNINKSQKNKNKNKTNQNKYGTHLKVIV
jgi:hypothetical protein